MDTVEEGHVSQNSYLSLEALIGHEGDQPVRICTCKEAWSMIALAAKHNEEDPDWFDGITKAIVRRYCITIFENNNEMGMAKILSNTRTSYEQMIEMLKDGIKRHPGSLSEEIKRVLNTFSQANIRNFLSSNSPKKTHAKKPSSPPEMTRPGPHRLRPFRIQGA